MGQLEAQVRSKQHVAQTDTVDSWENQAELMDLTFTGNKKLTRRELDIVACLLCGRSSTIPSFLSISQRTLEGHIRNITNKLGCNSREGIIDFAESSNKLSKIKSHYNFLVINNLFEKCLTQISSAIKREKISCAIVIPDSLSKEKTNLLNKIKDDFARAGIITTIEPLDADFSLTISEKKLSLAAGTEVHEKSTVHNQISFQLNQRAHMKNCYTLTLTNYHEFIFDLIKKVYVKSDIAPFIEGFQKRIQDQIHLENVSLGQIEPTIPKKNASKYIFFRFTLLPVAVMSMMAILGTIVFIFSTNRKNQIVIDLPTPVDSAFLKRTNIILHIDQILSNQKKRNLAFVGLVGIGGSGKTTLARSYAKQTKYSVIWEINAETKTSINNSFKSLAYALSLNKELREEIEFIMSIQNTEEKQKQIICFVQRQLKKAHNWLLIYDNVGSFGDNRNLFSFDSEVWGKGNIIITTRNENILESKYIEPSNIIKIPPLSNEDSFTLFNQILYKEKPTLGSSEKEINVKKLLAMIPPFPLDVSVAAYYIKNSSLSFEQYIKNLKKNFQLLDKGHHEFLQETSDYSQTRYDIITLCLTRLIESNPKYADLLLLICLCDSQNIPINFLSFFEDPELINHFVRDLKRYSLITTQSVDEINNTGYISIHRSTQQLAQLYLFEKFDSQRKNSFFSRCTNSFKKFYELYVYEDYRVILTIIPHLEIFLKNVDSLKIQETEKNKYVQTILYTLGNAYYQCSPDFKKEKEFFERANLLYEKNPSLSNLEYINMLKYFGYVCLELEYTNESIEYVKKAIVVCDRTPNSDVLSSSLYKFLGFAYLQDNKFYESESYFKQAISKIENTHDKTKKNAESGIYAYMGLLYSLNYIIGEKALVAEQFAKKALESIDGNQLFYKKKTLPPPEISFRIVENKVNLGEIYCRLGKYQEAYDTCFKDVDFILTNSFNNSSQTISKIISEICLAEIYLRTNQIEKAKATLTKSIENTQKTIGKTNRFNLRTFVFRAEAYIRLGQYDEAYLDCLIILKATRKNDNNYHQSLSLMATYHAAVVKYKQKDFQKSYEYFQSFFENIKILCTFILNENHFAQLNTGKYFDMPATSDSITADIIEKCFEKSAAIFKEIYGKDHPFFTEYVLKINI